MKDDEKNLMKALVNDYGLASKSPIRKIVDDLGINHKRAAYILWKWADKGWYEYGVSVMAGWLTVEGFQIMSDKCK